MPPPGGVPASPIGCRRRPGAASVPVRSTAVAEKADTPSPASPLHAKDRPFGPSSPSPLSGWMGIRCMEQTEKPQQRSQPSGFRLPVQVHQTVSCKQLVGCTHLWPSPFLVSPNHSWYHHHLTTHKSNRSDPQNQHDGKKMYIS